MPSSPFELVSAPITIYTAPERTAAPEISADPPAPWAQFGTNGASSYSEDGLTVSPEQTVEEQMVLGSTIAQKAFRTAESFTMGLTLFDLSAETFALMMSNQAITQTPPASGVGGRRDVPLKRGFEVHVFALLAKGFSPYGNNMFTQFWIPRCYISDIGEATYTKGEATGFDVEFMGLDDLTNGLGEYQAQYAPPA